MKLSSLAVLFILAVLLPLYAQEQVAEDIRELQKKVRDLREEVIELYLLNQLELTLEQATELKSMLGNLKLAKELQNQRALDNQKKMIEVLGKIRDSLEEGADEIPEELNKEYFAIRKKSNEESKEYLRKLKSADKELNELLTEAQLEIIDQYDGDIFRPAVDGPEGKVSRMAQVAKLIDRIRTVPPEQFDRVADKLIRQFMGRFIKDRGMRSGTQVIKRKIEEIAKMARVMDDFDYMLWREEFAKEVIDMASAPKQKNTQNNQGQKEPELSKAATFLLQESVFKALELRIELLEEPESKKPDSEKEKSEK